MEDNGLSFADQSLSLNSAEDAKIIVSAIEKCPCMVYFNLQGNSLGIKAAKEIGNALAKHGSHLKRALWQDMFTGRLKTEIPIVLEHFSAGLLTANVRLSELDLSNNAFGPIGMQGLHKVLNSPVCYELKTLRLMNNGLGISGAEMLADALIDNFHASLKAGTRFQLKVLVAGRNRLENDGIIALSKFFSLVGTMEEITIPQNGIYCKGIIELANSLLKNPNLKVLDVQDNLLTPDGAVALAKILPNLTNLKRLNIADCLIKSKGAMAIAEALTIHGSLEILDASYNEINGLGGLQLTKSLCNRNSLKEYNVNGNKFGEETISSILSVLKKSNKDTIIGSFSGDEGECSSDEDDNEQAVESSTDDEINSSKYNADCSKIFEDLVIDEIKLTKETLDHYNCELLIDRLMDIANSYHNSGDSVTLDRCLELYKEAYSKAYETLKFIDLTNTLLVKHGLIKSEDKSFKLRKDVDKCVEVLKKVVQNKNVIPEPSRCIIIFMLNRL